MYVSNVVREAWSIPCVIELDARAPLHILFSYINETVRRKKNAKFAMGYTFIGEARRHSNCAPQCRMKVTMIVISMELPIKGTQTVLDCAQEDPREMEDGHGIWQEPDKLGNDGQ
ncbi:unnamed protein product [Sphagnum troendelagicum]|uniref:Uncharacterized protein n=1 Tax=Sphagnum troendelagicum TaxID=128251 RepID=A0ABP0TFZ5_9BRYO